MIKMPLFGKSQKSPAEVVKALKEAVTSLEKGDKKLEKVRTESPFPLYFYITFMTHSLVCTGTGRCKQESFTDKEHALWHI